MKEDLTMKQATAKRPAKARRNAKFDFRKLKLVPILKRREDSISPAEAVRRARVSGFARCGKRFAYELAAAGNAGKIPRKIWRVGQYVIFARGSRRGRNGSYYVWYVFRGDDCFYCRYFYLNFYVDSSCRIPIQFTQLDSTTGDIFKKVRVPDYDRMKRDFVAKVARSGGWNGPIHNPERDN